MKEYHVTASLTMTAFTTVKAKSKEEALEIAKNREVGNMCYGAISPDEEEVWHFDNDGEPQNITID